MAAGYGIEPQVTNFKPGARLEAVRYLVEEVGLDVNGPDNQGYTPLHGAALTADHELIHYLVAMGGDVTARATNIFGGENQADKDAGGGKGDTVADMANGPRAHNMQFPDTVDLLVALRLDELRQLPLRRLRHPHAALDDEEVDGRQPNPSCRLYEYRCRACAHAFERWCARGDTPACPACASTDLERLISLFAVDSDGTRQAARDRSMAEGRQAPAGQRGRRRRALRAASPLTGERRDQAAPSSSAHSSWRPVEIAASPATRV